ncbi:serine-rich coiled-coil domain-containing protein 2-like isoform X2 [Clinocottus analis]|uniref:serine-rich coiled-coil domain-containing protein 2-like isoform X2 n=1 Tax=Clinocottus analis TaxID=304258 RepID=UPI0035C1B015
MSAPPTMSTMVSRLPKFGSRPKSTALSTGARTDPNAAVTAASTTTTRLTNGFYHHPGPAGVDGGLTAPTASVKQNGFIRVPTSSLSMKWRRENEPLEDEGADGEKERHREKGGNVGQNRPVGPAHQHYPQRDANKKTTTALGHGSGLPVTAPQSGPRTLPVPKSGSLGSKPSQTGIGLNGGPKQSPNGLSGSKPKGETGGSLRLSHGFARPGGSRPGSGLFSRPGSGPGSRSGSPLQKKPPASRCRSSDSLGPAAIARLAESDRIRSRSLTQVRRLPSPPALAPSSSSSSSSSVARHPTSTRSFSYSVNRAAGRGGGVVKGQSSAERSAVGVPSPLPPSALKKPLLSGLGPAFKPSGISYRLSRPSLVKQSRPLRATTANETGGEQEVKRGPTARRNSVETPSSTDDSPESSPEAAQRAPQREVSILGETLEDMSLSSSSSLDRNDTSQEYMDDFDNLGNGGAGLQLLSKNHEDDSGLDRSRARFHEDEAALCFLDDGVGWPAMGGVRGEHRLTRVPHRRRSSQGDDHEQGGSSLDLSPSDSCGSGGTYMWDEEGLEPLGGAAASSSTNGTNGNTTQHLGSFDSDLNSIDVLNNLDSCDLDDDDLMLDEDLPEDASLHEGVGVARMAQWRMRQLCWGTQDVHNDNDSDFQDSGNPKTDGDDELVLDFCSPRSPGGPALGLDVEELAEDCCAVRTQLEYLQSLLLQDEDVDEDTLTTDTLSPETSDSSSTQVQDLLQEVQQLREELRSRDRTIAHLTLQLAVPTATTGCRCQETRGTTDQHTQTSLMERESASQIFHTSSLDDQEPVTLRAPPPADSGSASSRPQKLAHVIEGARKEEEGDGKERRRVPQRSLQPPQPSKLHLFTSQISRPAAPPARRLPRDPESSEVKVKMAAFTSGLSRLPKPKSH